MRWKTSRSDKHGHKNEQEEGSQKPYKPREPTTVSLPKHSKHIDPDDTQQMVVPDGPKSLSSATIVTVSGGLILRSKRLETCAEIIVACEAQMEKR
jgi:hypothetical protein